MTEKYGASSSFKAQDYTSVTRLLVQVGTCLAM
jgi:hypothetical protein